jgi:hypothetical protein
LAVTRRLAAASTHRTLCSVTKGILVGHVQTHRRDGTRGHRALERDPVHAAPALPLRACDRSSSPSELRVVTGFLRLPPPAHARERFRKRVTTRNYVPLRISLIRQPHALIELPISGPRDGRIAFASHDFRERLLCRSLIARPFLIGRKESGCLHLGGRVQNALCG